MKKGWPTRDLGEVCKTASGGTPLKSRKEYYEGGNIPWLLSGEVDQGNVRAATNFITKQGLENSSARLFPKDTVLVAMYGAVLSSYPGRCKAVARIRQIYLDCRGRIPVFEGASSKPSIVLRTHAMARESEEVQDDPVDRQEPLRLSS